MPSPIKGEALTGRLPLPLTKRFPDRFSDLERGQNPLRGGGGGGGCPLPPATETRPSLRVVRRLPDRGWGGREGERRQDEATGGFAFRPRFPLIA